MNTLIYTALLGLFCMVAEIVNLRKIILPVLVIGLATIFGLNLNNWNLNQSYFNDMIKVDNFGVAFSGLVIFVTLLVYMLASEFYDAAEKHISDYMAILTFILCGALMMVMFNNLVIFFLGLETLSISLYVMAGSKRFELSSNEAGFKYFLMGSFMSGILLFGIALVFGSAQTFNIEKIAQYTIQNHEQLPAMFYVGMLLIVFAMLFKVSAAPFHFWAPDVYQGSPALATAFMSTLVKIAGFAAFYRLFSIAFIYEFNKVTLALTIVTIITLFAGNLMALAQQNFKRLLAFSGISHAGYMLLIILSIQAQPTAALLYYGTAYALSTLAAFAVPIPVFKSAKSEDISAFNGLAQKNPVLAAALTMAMLGLAGIPPFAGFLGKYYIFTNSLQNGYFYTTLIAIINSIIGVYYYFKVIVAMYGKPANETQIKTGFTYNMVCWVSLALSVILGLYPSLITHLL